jgi:RES domain-containing protein
MSLTGLRGLVFRVTSPRYRDLRRTAEMSRIHLGRFNTASIGAVYASAEPATAVEELRRRAARAGTSLTSMHPRSIFALRVDLHAVVDLTAPNALFAWGLSSSDLESDDLTKCQELATVAAQRGAEAVRWASATGRGQSLAIYVERLLPGSRAEIAHEFILSREMLAALDCGCRPRGALTGIAGFVAETIRRDVTRLGLHSIV